MTRIPIWATAAMLVVTNIAAEERSESFDRDPGWDGHQNRSPAYRRVIRQDYGFRRTNHVSGGAGKGGLGEIGGLIAPAGERSWYAKPLAETDLNRPFSASGRLIATGRKFHVLIGLFNSRTVGGWRDPNSISIRLAGRGDVMYAFVEYSSSRWRAGGDSPGGFATERDPQTGRQRPRGFALNKTLDWSLRYDPTAHEGHGAVVATIGDETSICHLDPDHRRDGATFNRFGIMPVLKHADDAGEIWLDDVTVNGELHDFSSDPGWEAINCRAEYETRDVRPRFDFGFSPTRHAGGKSAGELGGLVFRGDCRFPEKLAFLGDRLADLSTDRPLRASGRICLQRAVSDSTVLIGFFHATKSIAVSPRQDSALPDHFVGMAIEGPSREGFFLAPAYSLSGNRRAVVADPRAPRIVPDGESHAWRMELQPAAANAPARLVVGMDRQEFTAEIPGPSGQPTSLNRFGIVTTWIDGNGQRLLLDDLTYTCGQP